MGKQTESAPVQLGTPLGTPLVIDAITARLSTDIVGADKAGRSINHTVPTEELRLLVSILESAREVARQYAPSPMDQHRGEGTAERKLVAIERLVDAVTADIAT